MTYDTIDIAVAMTALGKRSKAAAADLAGCSSEQRNLALLSAAAVLRSSEEKILAANKNDMSAERTSDPTSRSPARRYRDHLRESAERYGRRGCPVP